MPFRILNAVMAALFAFAAAVQYNDPDPVRWIAIYIAAGVVSLVAARRGTAPLWAAMTVGVVALAWALMSMAGVTGLDVFAHMFDEWEMKSPPIEEAREASGLLIVAFWMAVIGISGLRSPRSAKLSM